MHTIHPTQTHNGRAALTLASSVAVHASAILLVVLMMDSTSPLELLSPPTAVRGDSRVVLLFTADRAQYLLCSLSFALAVVVSSVVYLSDLSCFLPQHLSYAGSHVFAFVNSGCGLRLLNVSTQAYALWLQSITLTLPLSIFYLARANTACSVLRLVAASYRTNIATVRRLSGDDMRKAFTFAFLRSRWPWREEVIPDDEEPSKEPSLSSQSFRAQLLTTSREQYASTLPYSLEKELGYAHVSTSLARDPTGDKAAFTYLLDHVCYPQSFEWVRGKAAWTRWYLVTAIGSMAVSVIGAVVWFVWLGPSILTIDRSDFWCGDLPLFRSSFNTTTNLSGDVACVYSSQETLLGVWWFNVVLLLVYTGLLVWRVVFGIRWVRTDRDFLYHAMLDTFPELLLPNISQARGFLRNRVRMAGHAVPNTTDAVHWVPAIRAAWVGEHVRYERSLKRRREAREPDEKEHNEEPPSVYPPVHPGHI